MGEGGAKAPWSQGHFYNYHYQRWPDCTAGWYPDPLLDVPATGIPRIPAGATQPIFVELCVPRSQPAGNFSGRFEVHAGGAPLFTVPVSVEVWDIILPSLNDTSAFNTAFTFGSTLQWRLYNWYPNLTYPEIWEQWYPFLAKHRIPGDDLYQGNSPGYQGYAPNIPSRGVDFKPIAEYQVMAKAGAKWMNLKFLGNGADVWNQTTHPGEAFNASVQAKAIAGYLSDLELALGNLSAVGLEEKAYLYGFDEAIEYKWGAKESIYTLFGAIKRRFPQLRTMATLNWPAVSPGTNDPQPGTNTPTAAGGIPDDFPLNVWVNEYSTFGQADHYRNATLKQQARQRWLQGGANRSFWWYWCLSPEPPEFMNTFIERPAIDTRLMYWLAALHGIDGMLYYQVDLVRTQTTDMRLVLQLCLSNLLCLSAPKIKICPSLAVVAAVPDDSTVQDSHTDQQHSLHRLQPGNICRRLDEYNPAGRCGERGW